MLAKGFSAQPQAKLEVGHLLFDHGQPPQGHRQLLKFARSQGYKPEAVLGLGREHPVHGSSKVIVVRISQGPRLVGASLVQESAVEEGTAALHWMLVAQSRRGQGLGRKMIDYIRQLTSGRYKHLVLTAGREEREIVRNMTGISFTHRSNDGKWVFKVDDQDTTNDASQSLYSGEEWWDQDPPQDAPLAANADKLLEVLLGSDTEGELAARLEDVSEALGEALPEDVTEELKKRLRQL